MKVKHIKKDMVIKTDMHYPVDGPKGLWVRRIALVTAVKHLKNKSGNTRLVVLKFFEHPLLHMGEYVGRFRVSNGLANSTVPTSHNKLRKFGKISVGLWEVHLYGISLKIGESAFFSDELRTIREIPKAEAMVWRLENNT